MKRKMIIDGMSCGHCSARVEKALKEVGGVSDATVDLDSKCASITLAENIPDEILKTAVSDAGYDVVSVSHE